MIQLNKKTVLASLVLMTALVHSQAQNVGIGTATPTEKLHVVGGTRITSLSGLGNRMVITDANGVLGTQAIPAGGGTLTGVTAGDGLTGGGTIGNPTLDVVAINGLTTNANDIRLGGTLIQNTTINQGIFSMTYNLDNTGDFTIQDNAVNKFTVLDDGSSAFGDDVFWRDGNSTTGTILAELVDDGNDGRFRIMENGLTSVDLDANTQFIFNEQGLDRDFRVESDNDANMLFVDGGNNRIGVGTALPTETIHVQGGARITSLTGIGNRMVVSNANGVLSTQAIPTGGGTATADNGLNIAGGGEVYLGGNLTENTTITQGAFGMTYELDGTGDFRVESNSNNNMLFVDGGNNRIGVGTGGPTQALHVVGGIRSTVGAVIGQHPNYGTHLLTVAAGNTPSVQFGSMTFNQVEAGRLTFEEQVPNYPLAGGAYCGFQIHNDGATDKLHFRSACTAIIDIMTLERNGDVGISTDNPTANLSVNGTANKTGGGNWAVFSDRRLKKDVSDFTEGLDFITKVRAVNFKYNDQMAEIWGEDTRNKDRVYQGVIAQELQEIAPDMVRAVDLQENANPENADYDPSLEKENKTFLEVDPNKFTYALINAVKEQQAMIEQLKVEQANTKKELAVLKAMLKK